VTEINIDNNKYWLDINPTKMEEWQWCDSHFGWINNNRHPDYWQGSVTWGGIRFRFKNPYHASMFALRWAEDH